MPTDPLTSVTAELPTSVVLTYFASAVGVPVLTTLAGGGVDAFAVDAFEDRRGLDPLPDAFGAKTYAEAGWPPSVSASAARSAYGTLVSRVRGFSVSPRPANCTANQRSLPSANRETGRPSGY